MTARQKRLLVSFTVFFFFTSIRKCLWRGEWQPTPVFLPGEFHGQRSLAGYNPWGHRDLDTTQRLSLTH